MKNENLTFYECIQLLHQSVEAGVLFRDPNEKNNIVIYFSGNEDNPEGWYTRNLLTAAQELVTDVEGQKTILNALKEKGKEFEPVPNPFLENDGLHKKNKKDCAERE